MTLTVPDPTGTTSTVPDPTVPDPTVPTSTGTVVCRYDDLEPERGVAAMVGEVQVALFRLDDGRVVAVDHRDPFCGANVMARGLVGSRGAVPTVASPMYKQVFDLLTGRCLDDPTVALTSYPVQVSADGLVRVMPGAAP
jgi:nitrite reductase (NADH) small subunit